MDFLPKEIVLRSGRKLILRAPRVEDAQTLVEYLNATAGESPWLPREPGESRITSFEQEAQFIEGIISSPDDLMLLAFVEGEFAGNCQINFMRRRKSAHRASIGITLYKKFWGMGIGTAMFREMLGESARHRAGRACLYRRKRARKGALRENGLFRMRENAESVSVFGRKLS